MADHPYDDVCNDEPWRVPDVDERLAAPGRAGPEWRLSAYLDDLARRRIQRANTELMIHGTSLYHVTYGEEQIDLRADRAAKPSRWQRLKWSLEWRAQAALDFINEAQYRVRGAWSVLRHGRFYG